MRDNKKEVYTASTLGQEVFNFGGLLPVFSLTVLVTVSTKEGAA